MNDFNDKNFDDFDDDSFDDFKEEKPSLKTLWEKPIVKIVAVAIGIILFIYVLVLILSEDNDQESRLRNAPDRREVLGGEISQSYADVLEEVNEQRLESALQRGDSTIPMLINPEEQDLLTESQQRPPVDDFDPLATFRAAQNQTPDATELPEEDPILVSPQDLAPAAPPVIAPSPEAVQALATAMSGAVGNVINGQPINAPRIMQVAPENFFQIQAEAEAARLAAAAGGQTDGVMIDTDGDGILDTFVSDGGGTDEPVIETILIPAGEINYAQLLVEANSDVPGPVLARLVSGPLAGARLIGTFQVAEDVLILSFTSIVIDGLNQPISAVAIDPATTLPGVATEVDQRYFTRVLLPAAARFLEGVGSAIAEDTETTVTVSGDTVIEQQDALDFEQELGRGVEEGFSEIADFMDDEADNTQPLIRVARGTALGIFFTQPVIENGGSAATTADDL